MIRFARSLLRFRGVVILLGALLLGAAALVSNASLIGDPTLRMIRAKLNPQQPSGRFVAVEIDGPSLVAVGRWPWPRRVHAELIDRLDRAGARKIAFDVDFSATSNPVDDALLASAIARARGKVIIGAMSERDASGREIAASLPLPAFRRNAQVAAIMGMIDDDNVMRSALTGLDIGGRHYPSMAVALAGRSPEVGGQFPLDPAIRLDAVVRLSASDVVAGRFDPAVVRGRAVLIGSTAQSMADRLFLLDHYTAGMFGHLLGAETLTERPDPRFMGPNLPLVLAMLAVAVVAFVRSRRVVVATTACAFAVLLAGAFLLEVWLGWYVSTTPALLALAAAVVMRLIVSLAGSFLAGISTNELSGLPNAHALHSDTPKAFRRPVAVARLHNLAAITSVLGDGPAGEVLRKLSERIALATEGAQVYHVSDALFAWVVPAGAEDDIADRFDALHALMSAPVRINQRPIDVALTYGLCSTEPDLQAAIRAASLAAERAQARGLRWTEHSAGEQDEASWRLALLGELDDAIGSDEIWVAYQPKFELASQRIVGAEALVRWRHRERGPIPPDHFVPLAEASGRIGKLTRFVLETALADLASVAVHGERPCVAINLSTTLLGEAGLVEMVCDALWRNGVQPDQLMLEITESAAMTTDEAAVAVLARFRSMGIGISIDDYGTGQSSLAYLKTLPATELKIDQSFVRAITDSRSDEILVNSTIQLGHQLGLKVVAEGVESTQVMGRLEAFGCDLIQGYLIGKPVPFDEFARGWRRSAALASAA